MQTFACPHCGGEVPAKRRSCPHCGSSEDDGWGDPETDLEDDAFDYEEYSEREFGTERDINQPLSQRELQAARVRLVVWVVIISLVLPILLPLLL